jgi:hypothetical protein
VSDEYEIECPMPGCTESLHLEWMSSYQLSPKDVTDGCGLAPSDSYCQDWKVVCLAGHVVLLPTEHPHCPCEDPEGPDCSCDQDAFDHSDEYRTFRAHDKDRLTAIITKLRGLEP